jgi:CheY-like chemotaxis protein
MPVEPERARVLLIEDQDLDARVVELALKRPVEDAYEIYRALCLKEGLEAVEKFDPELALVDLNLADAQGLETVTTFQEKYPNLPIIVLTGTKDPEIAMEALEAGAEDFVYKDEFQRKHFKRTIQYALERNRTRLRLIEMERQMQEMLRLQSLSTLAGGIAHDFNNALTTVMGNLSVILDRGQEEEDESLTPLRDAQDSLYRAKHLSHQLLALSQKDQLELKTKAPAELVENTWKYIKNVDKVDLRVDLPDDLWPVRVDEYKIINVLHNIFTNALEAVNYRGQIHVKARNSEIEPGAAIEGIEPGQYVCISTRDAGDGIADQARNHVFDAYFSTKGTGRGAGLANALSIVRRHGGIIAFEDAEDHGAVFHVYLPAQPEGEIGGKEQEHEPSKGSGKILMMDDDPAVQKSVSFMLKRLGYTTEVADDGEEGMTKFRQAQENGEPYDGLILDLTVPGGMGGKEMIQLVRKENQEVPVIVSSGYSDDDVLTNPKAYGFNGKLPKPFTLKELSSIIEQVFGG